MLSIYFTLKYMYIVANTSDVQNIFLNHLEDIIRVSLSFEAEHSEIFGLI